jgi:predicted ATPase
MAPPQSKFIFVTHVPVLLAYVASYLINYQLYILDLKTWTMMTSVQGEL